MGVKTDEIRGGTPLGGQKASENAIENELYRSKYHQDGAISFQGGPQSLMRRQRRHFIGPCWRKIPPEKRGATTRASKKAYRT